MHVVFNQACQAFYLTFIQGLSSSTPFAWANWDEVLPVLRESFLSFIFSTKNSPIILPFPLSDLHINNDSFSNAKSFLQHFESLQLDMVFLFWDSSQYFICISHMFMIIFSSLICCFLPPQILISLRAWTKSIFFFPFLTLCALFYTMLSSANICWMNQLIDTIKDSCHFLKYPFL